MEPRFELSPDTSGVFVGFVFFVDEHFHEFDETVLGDLFVNREKSFSFDHLFGVIEVLFFVNFFVLSLSEEFLLVFVFLGFILFLLLGVKIVPDLLVFVVLLVHFFVIILDLVLDLKHWLLIHVSFLVLVLVLGVHVDSRRGGYLEGGVIVPICFFDGIEVVKINFFLF